MILADYIEEILNLGKLEAFSEFNYLYTLVYKFRKVVLICRQEYRLNTDFEIGKPLGEGKFGHVYLARTAREKRYVALKVIHSKQIEEDRMEHQVNRETDIHIDLE